MAVKAIPEGYHTVTPHMVIKDAAGAIEFYKKAFGAEEVFRMPGPDGKTVMHGEIQIGNSRIMMCEEWPQMEGCKSPATLKGTTTTVHLYVQDADAAFKRAVNAGAKEIMPVMDTFWGDRYGKVADPYGHHWSIATHKQDLTPEQIQKNAEEWFANSPECGKQ